VYKPCTSCTRQPRGSKGRLPPNLPRASAQRPVVQVCHRACLAGPSCLLLRCGIVRGPRPFSLKDNGERTRDSLYYLPFIVCSKTEA
jgi:hypothetical protein